MKQNLSPGAIAAAAVVIVLAIVGVYYMMFKPAGAGPVVVPEPFGGPKAATGGAPPSADGAAGTATAPGTPPFSGAPPGSGG